MDSSISPISFIYPLAREALLHRQLLVDIRSNGNQTDQKLTLSFS
jgi:hypothetical protein